jgi:hypothetical protein
MVNLGEYERIKGRLRRSEELIKVLVKEKKEEII